MAVTSVVERLDGDHNWSVGQYSPTREFTRYFWVYSDTRDESPVAVRTATGIPAPNDAHPNDSGSIVQKVRCRRDVEFAKRWEVECEYSSANPRNQEDEPPTSVTDIERITVSTRQGQLLLERDRSGNLIKNTAGDLIEGLTVPWNALTIQIENYVTSAPDYYVTSKWINVINSATWRGVPAYFAKIGSLTYNEDNIDGVNCWKRVAVVELAHVDSQPWGWRTRVLNAGLRAKVSGQLRHIRDDKTQNFISRPVPLKSDGSKADIAGGVDSPYYLDIEVYPEAAFSGLGI